MPKKRQKKKKFEKSMPDDHLRNIHLMTAMETYYSIVVDVIRREFRQAGQKAQCIRMNLYKNKFFSRRRSLKFLRLLLNDIDKGWSMDIHRNTYGKRLEKVRETKNISRMIINAFSFPLRSKTHLSISRDIFMCISNICFSFLSLTMCFTTIHFSLLCVLIIMLLPFFVFWITHKIF